MIAMGSAIGVGLFLGSTVTIGLAGPGVIITYVAGAVIALIMGYALAEMAVVHPLAGSFGVYAEQYLSPWFGFVVRATYAFGGDRALQVWYRDTTLHWITYQQFARHPETRVATIMAVLGVDHLRSTTGTHDHR